MVQRDPIGEIFKRLSALGQKAQLDRGQRKFIRQFRIGTAEFLRDPGKGGIDRQSGLRTDNQQIDRVGQTLADQVGALGDQIVDVNIGSFISQDR